MNHAGDHWERELQDIGAFWLHDRNPKRPFARLTSGLISEGFVNCGIMMSEHPHRFAKAVRDLADKAHLNDPKLSGRVIGAAKGAINLAYQLAAYTGRSYAYAEKSGDELVFEERFSQHFKLREHFILCEDTMTTGNTIRKLICAGYECAPRAQFEPVILVICNRSGQERMEGFDIVSLIDRRIQTWKEGENPYTEDGRELVEPVRPKTHWEELTKKY